MIAPIVVQVGFEQSSGVTFCTYQALPPLPASTLAFVECDSPTLQPGAIVEEVETVGLFLISADQMVRAGVTLEAVGPDAPCVGVDACTPITAQTPCSDGNVCNGDETCSPSGACVDVTPPTVSDSDPCTLDSCDPIDGFQHVTCSPLDPTVPTRVADAYAFIYTGPNAVQKGLDPNDLVLERIGLLRGQVLNRDGQPVMGAVVTVLADNESDPDYGYTTTQADGYYTLAVNGGRPMAVNIDYPGHLRVQRRTLYAEDANGSLLPSMMASTGSGIELHVDDAGAVYPLTIDPIWGNTAILAPPEEDMAGNFGVRVDLEPNRVAITANETQGVSPLGGVYVFERTGLGWDAGTLVQPAWDDLDYVFFGEDVELEGDTLIVATRVTTAGAATYVYRFVGNAWALETKLMRDDSGNFGKSISLWGDRLAVGAPLSPAPNGTPNLGAVYILERDGGAWTEMASITPPDVVPAQHFGYQVALEGDRLAVATRNDNFVYVFNRQGTDWVQEAKLQAVGGGNIWKSWATSTDAYQRDLRYACSASDEGLEITPRPRELRGSRENG